VPGNDKRYAQFVRQRGAQDAAIAQGGGMDDVWLKGLQSRACALPVALEQRIEAEVGIHRPSPAAALEFANGHRSLLENARLGACMQTEERQFVAARIIVQLAAGERHAVDFVKAIREERDA
jgi:hypothetical protein